MITFALGLGTLALLLWGARAFSRARVSTIKTLLAWVAALAGLSVATGLLLTGRGGAALAGLVLLGPLVWSWWQDARAGGARAPGSGQDRGRGQSRGQNPGRNRGMSRAEALEVLGLHEGATEAEIRAAWLRLMRTAHPDGGGSDWLAARVNQAKDVLLGKR